MKVDFEAIQQELIDITKSKGWKVVPTTMNYHIYSPYKELRLKFYEKNEEMVICFCHEIGHIIDIEKGNHDDKLYDTNLIYKLWSELKASLYGYFLYREYKLSKVNYIKRTTKGFLTYIKSDRDRRKFIKSTRR